MRALKFRLSAEFGCFRDLSEGFKELTTTKQIPSNIQLGGLLGAITGLEGYGMVALNKLDKNIPIKLPDFYTTLKNMHYSIVSEKPKFNVSKQVISNTNGSAVKNIKAPIVTANMGYQVLEKPSYIVYIYFDEAHSEIYNTLKYKLENTEVEYQTYFGFTHFFSNFDYLGEHDLTVVNADELVIDSWFEDSKANYDINYLDFSPNKKAYYMRERYATEFNPSMLKKTNITVINTSSYVEYSEETYLDDSIILAKLSF